MNQTLTPIDGSQKLTCSNCPEALHNNPVLNAAERGNSVAAYLAYHWYLRGTGGAANERQAFYWLTLAAKAKQQHALATLGKALLYGTHPAQVRQDVTGGCDLIMAAAKEGNNESAVYLGTAWLEGIPALGIRADEFIGIVFIELAARRGDMRALEMMVRYGIAKDEPADKVCVWAGALRKLSSSKEVQDWCEAVVVSVDGSSEPQDAVDALVRRIGYIRKAESAWDGMVAVPPLDEPHARIRLASPLRVVGLPRLETSYAQFF